jgi:hypothetical protein
MDPRTIDVQAHQRLEALARANRVRQARAEVKRRIADGDVSAAEVILFHRWEVESMAVAEVLTSQRHWGDMRCRRFLTPMRVQESKTIGSMTERQRVALAARLSACTSPHGQQTGSLSRQPALLLEGVPVTVRPPGGTSTRDGFGRPAGRDPGA